MKEKNNIMHKNKIVLVLGIIIVIAFALRVFQINSIGDINCRAKYKKVLQDCLSKNKSVLCDNCQKDIQNRIFNI